ncbi:uncharacterized protein MONBRDRAFT_36868 [Monosiga brevicollis MX1]|uniref:FHA domain-containing protein n=1 Tax=Monosiga brevicollis TaxID=81824 RepID=A9UYB3_MONBE|nr:uncharacterized protein MONBRDRAFT_36868 [Monosiga brevicollis MX1]EDQ89991.1 predicted protein [Monosiga brevicollis MX1]|eukprot:XP_001745413.1 hypothetical protein [Monosiga brevicollis MX1]
MASTSGAPVLILIPVATPGRTEIRREIVLKYAQKVGRAVPNKAKPAKDNAVFDSKVLSRSHAEIWADDNKVFIRDTKSSNGTYVNDERLSPGGMESAPRQLKTGDKLRLGVDVVENNTAAHKCVVLEVVVKGDDASISRQQVLQALQTPIEVLETLDALELIEQIKAMQEAHVQQQTLLSQLQAKVQAAEDAESSIAGRLATLQSEFTQMAKIAATYFQVCDLFSPCEAWAAFEESRFQILPISLCAIPIKRPLGTWMQQKLVDQDRLVARMDLLNEQIQFYQKRCHDLANEPKTESEVKPVPDIMENANERVQKAQRAAQEAMNMRNSCMTMLDACKAQLQHAETEVETEKRKAQDAEKKFRGERNELLSQIEKLRTTFSTLEKATVTPEQLEALRQALGDAQYAQEEERDEAELQTNVLQQEIDTLKASLEKDHSEKDQLHTDLQASQDASKQMHEELDFLRASQVSLQRQQEESSTKVDEMLVQEQRLREQLQATNDAHSKQSRMLGRMQEKVTLYMRAAIGSGALALISIVWALYASLPSGEPIEPL